MDRREAEAAVAGRTGIQAAGEAGAEVAPWDVPPWESRNLRARLVAFARRFVGDPAEAEDVAQEALHRASVGRATLRSADRAEAWLFRICRHAAIDHVRARRVRQGVWGAMPEAADDWARAPAMRADASPPGRSVDLRRLPAHQRLLVVLHYERGLSQATICRMTGLSPSALRVRLFRARQTLAEEAGAELGADGRLACARDAAPRVGEGCVERGWIEEGCVEEAASRMIGSRKLGPRKLWPLRSGPART